MSSDPRVMLWPVRTLPAIVRAGRFILSEMDFAWRYRHRTVALHVHDYRGRMRIAEREIALEPGDLTLSLPGVTTRYALPEPGRHWCVHFAARRGMDATIALPVHQPLGTRRARVVDRLRRIIALIAIAGDARRAMIASAAASACLQELLLDLALDDERGRRGCRTDVAVDAVAAAIHRRFAESLTVSGLAGEAHLGNDHLARCFRRRFGMTVQRYLLDVRIAHARDLIAQTTLPIGEIGRRVGIPDPQYFNKLYRRTVGSNPSAARSRLRSGDQPRNP